MPKAICVRCGALHFGWALRYLPDRVCARCGGPLAFFGEHEEKDESRREHTERHLFWPPAITS